MTNNNFIAVVEISPLLFFYTLQNNLKEMIGMPIIIKYLPKGTSKEEIKTIRKMCKTSGDKLILMISGYQDIKENLCEFIKSRKI